eukprot:gene19909-30621_t
MAMRRPWCRAAAAALRRRWCSSGSGAAAAGLHGELQDEVRKLAGKDQEMSLRLHRFLKNYNDGKANKQWIEAEFEKLDKDGDGSVTRQEYAHAHRERFEKMDANNDGVITPSEYKRQKAKEYHTWINAIPDLRSHQLHGSNGAANTSTDPPSTSQLLRLCTTIGLPMIGFGFIDNLIMIVCGDLIDANLGMFMQLSTMAAAGLGNMCSDVAGLGLSKAIEECAEQIGIEPPGLSEHQSSLFIVKFLSLAATVIGVCFGCLLGMFPLLFMDSKSKGGPVAEPAKISGGEKKEASS